MIWRKLEQFRHVHHEQQHTSLLKLTETLN